MQRLPVVAIDGPAGAGKSTVARDLAHCLGFTLLDTGALYRGVALACSRARVSWDDTAAVGTLARALAEKNRLRLVPQAGSWTVRLWLDEQDESEAIRTPAISRGASQVSVIPEVRAALLAMQRAAGAAGGVVVEGRDIGTVVFPDAEVKFFLTAAPEERARRRCDELRGKGIEASFETTLAEVLARDAQDSQRAVSPLRQADDAVLVDSTGLAAHEVVERMAAVVRARSPRPAPGASCA